MLNPCTFCPKCGSKNIHRVIRDIERPIKDYGTFIAKNISFDECLDCNEIVFDKYAMDEIDEQRKSYKSKIINKKQVIEV